MQMVVLTNDGLKEELFQADTDSLEKIYCIKDLDQLEAHPDADVVIDLLFERAHLDKLRSLQNKLVIINCVEYTLAETDPSFVRINGWPTLLKSSIIEGCCIEEDKKQKSEEVFSLFHKKVEWLPDEPGFVTPRVISMIINEAFLSLKEGVSSKEEIDTAMKLGTNYPYGPFEWAKKIGVEKIQSLLGQMSVRHERYTSNVS
jgi:3-hydroxybutyryl-CoA dehydrogenase